LCAISEKIVTLKNTSTVVLPFLHCLSILAPAEKQLDWQTGTVKDSDIPNSAGQGTALCALAKVLF